MVAIQYHLKKMVESGELEPTIALFSISVNA
jgi:hypothetical protein